jgi:hypothetical protein
MSPTGRSDVPPRTFHAIAVRAATEGVGLEAVVEFQQVAATADNCDPMSSAARIADQDADSAFSD